MFEYQAEVVRVIDGDTLRLNIDLGFKVHLEISARLARINTPERGQDGAQAATERLRSLCPAGSQVTVRTAKGDRYGRWIAEVMAGGANVSDMMLAEGLAVTYEG